MSKNFVFVLVFLVGAALGAGLVYYLGFSPQAGTGGSTSELGNILDSKISKDVSVTLHGQIQALSDDSLTVKGNGASVVLKLSNKTIATKMFSAPKPPETIKMGELKTGDNVDVSASVSTDKTLQVLNIILLAPAASTSVSPSPEPSSLLTPAPVK